MEASRFVFPPPAGTKARFQLTWSFGLPREPACVSDAAWDDLYPLGQLARVLVVDSFDRSDGWTESLQSLFSLGAALGREPFTAYVRAGANIQVTACAAILHLLDHGRCAAVDVSPWIDRLRVQSGELDLGAALASHRAVGLEMIAQVRAGSLPIDPERLSWAARNIAGVLDASICQEALEFLRPMNEAIALAGEPYWEIRERIERLDAADVREERLVEWLDVRLTGAFENVADARTARGLAAAALALLAHRQETGRWATDLDPDAIDHRTGRRPRLEIRADDAWIVLPDVGEWRVRAPESRRVGASPR